MINPKTTQNIHKRSKTRAGALLLAAAMISAGCRPTAVSASSVTWTSLPQTELSDSRIPGISAYSLSFGTGNQTLLNEKEQELYTKLKMVFADIADGTRNSTEFTVDIAITGTFPSNTTDQHTAIQDYLTSSVNIPKVIRMLLADCPYELYWFHKSRGYQTAYSTPDISNDTFHIRQLAFSFCTSDDFAEKNDDGTCQPYLVDSAKAAYAKSAKAAAEQIVETYASLDDYGKLSAYLKEICALTEYDTNAAGTVTPDVNGPWQLISVFDRDTSTNVVCEGYAKAFAYLCERSSFENDICCYIVTGQLNANSGTQDTGGHMWNIVTMDDGQNYLVDVTNCDESSIGAPDQLFLAGLSGSIKDGYTFTGQRGHKAVYTYDPATAQLFPASVLQLASTGYVPSKGDTTEKKPADSDLSECHTTITKRTDTNSKGKQVSVTITTQTDASQTVTSTEKKSVIKNIGANTTATVTIRENGSGKILHAAADVTKILAAGSNIVLNESILSQISEAADGKNTTLTLTIRNTAGTVKCKLKTDTKDLYAANKLFLYRLGTADDPYIMVNAKTCTVNASGSLTVPLMPNGTYQLLTKAKAKAAAKAIRSTITPKTASIALAKGKSTTFSFNRKFNLENVKKISYSSSNKNIVSVTKTGKITAKKAGTAVIRAKVELKDKSAKTVSIQVRAGS